MGEPAERRILGGRYEIEGVLGRGGMGVVYRGRDLTLRRPVAIKLLEARLSTEGPALARFRREAHSAARLNHPNVVTVYDSGVDRGDHFIVMELLSGGTLTELLHQRGELPLPLALAIGDDILNALSAAHEAGLVHRDVSPGNVMITPDGTAKVTDFGIARAFGPDADQTGSIAGTAAYLAPEQAAGEPVTPAADLYGVGCVLYAMLTGRPPFGGENPLAVATRHREERPATPSSLRSGLPPAVDGLVLRALEKRPEDRFSSARSMRAELERIGVPLPAPGERHAWPATAAAEAQRQSQTAVTRIVPSSEQRSGDTALMPAAAAGAGIARAGIAGTGVARAAASPTVATAAAAEVERRLSRPAARRPSPRAGRRLSRPVIAIVALLVAATAVVILLAAVGVLSSSPSASDAPVPAPTHTAPPTTPATKPATSSPSPAAPGKGGPPGKGPKKTKPDVGKKKGQTGQTTTAGAAT